MNSEKNLPCFYSNFPDILYKILSVLPKTVKFVNNSVSDLNFKDKKVLLTTLLIFLSKNLAKYFKTQPFSSKNCTI